MSEDFVMTGAERKLSRQIMAELNAASCHLALMLNACLLQWQWGLRGGKPGEQDLSFILYYYFFQLIC